MCRHLGVGANPSALPEQPGKCCGSPWSRNSHPQEGPQPWHSRCGRAHGDPGLPCRGPQGRELGTCPPRQTSRRASRWKRDSLSSKGSLQAASCAVVPCVWGTDVYLPFNHFLSHPSTYLSFSCLTVCKSVSSLWFGKHVTTSEQPRRWSSELLSNMNK